MSDRSSGKRLEEDNDDFLWNDFENCAQAVTLLYRNASWKTLQTAAASTTQLYRSGIESKKKAYEKGFIAGKQNLARELIAMRRYQQIAMDDFFNLLSKIACVSENAYGNRSPSPEQTNSQAVTLFQQALCIPTSVASSQNSNDLNTFLACQLHRRRKRRHSPTECSAKKMYRS